MAPGSVPAGSGRAGSFSSSEILEQVALALAAAAGLASGLVLSWVLGPVVGGGPSLVLFRFASERGKQTSLAKCRQVGNRCCTVRSSQCRL